MEQEDKASPLLVIMVGPPATGKSHLARRIAQVLSCRVVETDAIRKELFRQPQYTPEEHQVVFQEAHTRIARLLEAGTSVVFDATNLIEAKRRVLYSIAEDRGALPVPVRTLASPDGVRERLQWRELGVDPEDLSDAGWQVYERFSRQADPIMRPHWVVNTQVESPRVIRYIASACQRRPSARHRSPVTPPQASLAMQRSLPQEEV